MEMYSQKKQPRRRIGKGRQNKTNEYGLTNNRGYTQIARPSWQFLEPHQYLTFKYSDFQTITLLTVTGVTQIYNLNSLFDPDRTGTGHQPYGYDQLAAMYNRYRVLRTKWKVVFATSSGDYFGLVIPSNGLLASAPTTLAPFITASECPLSKSIIQSSTSKSEMISGTARLNELNGVTRTEYLADDRFESQVSASPAELMVLYLAFYNPNVGTTIINFNITLEYEADLHDPILLAGS
jgi:hypothetical protein